VADCRHLRRDRIRLRQLHARYLLDVRWRRLAHGGQVTPIDVIAAQESFQTPLVVQYEDGHNWVVYEEFVYVSPRITIHIPKGFETDFASIPRFLWRWMPPTDRRIGKPSIVHDFIYRSPNILFTRQEADNELREAMKCVGASAIDRGIVYWGVRAGGAGAFKPRTGGSHG
jgi:hypothetical protein